MPRFDKSIMHPTRKRIDFPASRPRVNWANNLDSLEDKMRRSFFAMLTALWDKAMGKAATIWTRAISFVGWAMLAYDVYDGVSTAADLRKQFQQTEAVDGLRQNAAQGFSIAQFISRC